MGRRRMNGRWEGCGMGSVLGDIDVRDVIH